MSLFTFRRFLIAFASLLCAELMATTRAASVSDPRGGQFIGFTGFSSFEKAAGARSREIVLTSPVILSKIKWNELVASWNADTPDGAYLKIEARGIYLDRSTKYFTMGLWSSNPARAPRECVLHQKDEDGDVKTDTLVLNRPAERVQIRVTMGSSEPEMPKLKFLGLCLTDNRVHPDPLPANRAAWGKELAVPERFQMNYPNGKVLCSATTTSMIMSYWARQLHRPEMEHDVPDIVKAIYDAKFDGTGNWPFNTAYAGSYRGMRAYVSRFSDLSEVEDWIAAGIPVALSVCSDRLNARGPGPNGHLITCVGFTPEGDPVINDPGKSNPTRRVYPRKRLIYAWSYSQNAVYLMYPEDSEVPQDRFGHWQSWTSRQRVTLER
ncbi:MAG: hypothetical protein C5B50_06555 [Verrucomicrobia bacterium]|nr:MAG: hypothetical protein C5B50_06555 [Verrucomicrobiota bacterium]